VAGLGGLGPATKAGAGAGFDVADEGKRGEGEGDRGYGRYLVRTDGGQGQLCWLDFASGYGVVVQHRGSAYSPVGSLPNDELVRDGQR